MARPSSGRPHPVKTIEHALKDCGVTEKTLAARDKEVLDQHGYIVFSNVIEPKWLAQLRSAFETAVNDVPKTKDPKQTGTRHVADLERKDPAFDDVYTHPKILAAAYHILRRPFRVLHLSGRDPLPGFGQQGLHNDWTWRGPADPYNVVTSIWLLDDFVPANGATRLVPGSHLFPKPLPKSMQAPGNHHPDERVVVAKAGSVLVLNGHLWHSGTRNQSSQPRRVLQLQFIARDAMRPTETASDVPERFTAAARFILGV